MSYWWHSAHRGRDERTLGQGVPTTRRGTEGGFTLIELLVVVLILGILMAIAIPTFLNLTSGAKTSSAEADLTTATQDESAYLTTNGDFDGLVVATASFAADNATGLAGMSTTDPGFAWTVGSLTGTAGKKTILVAMGTTSQMTLMLGSAGQNGLYYWVYDNAGSLSYDINAVATVPATPTTTTWGLVPSATPWGASWKLATSAL